MITLHQGYVSDKDGVSTLATEIDIGDNKREVRLSVDSEYGKFFSPERADYALTGMLAYALRNKHDIICEAPVTDELLYNIQEILIPTFVRSDPRNYPVKIQADIAPPLEKLPIDETRRGGVGTGISCGVDSFYSVLKHIDTRYACRNLTHLCIFNNGSLVRIRGRNLTYKQEVFARAEAVAAELNLPLLKLESNFQNVFPQSHYRTHTYMDALAIYALQKLWRVYYYGSSNSYSGFSLEKNCTVAPGQYEPFLLDCFSTSQIKFISSGSEGDHNDKVEFLADKPTAQKYLHVCLKRGDTNCGRCGKCLRTLIALDAINKLDDFRESFDIDDYLKIRDYAYVYMYDKFTLQKNIYFVKSYEILYERHKEFFDSITPETKRLFKVK